MSIAKITEISSTSPKSFEDAIRSGIARANKTLQGIKGAWVSEFKLDVTDGKITAYRVNMRITFVLND
jgi:flavin-binding protein dodecin